ncbi:MAG: prepilin peptidase [Candidatus Omnitrophica bacterium]|nr:prepilin peptidase [Candidatus Omnitrophota bacterium]
MITKIITFIFGSIIGSFLNVCIYRMPQGKSVVWPGSHCPLCEKRIPWYDNIPFISYLLLRGRCRFCRQKISLRYLIVELLTALMFVALLDYFGLTYDFFVYLSLVCLLIIASFVDIKHRIIPDEISLGGILLGFILNCIKGLSINPFTYNSRPMINSLLGIIIGGAVIYLTGKLFDLFYFKLLKRPPIQGETESLGGGDVKLLAMIGAFLGWQKALLSFFIAPFFGAIVGIINLIIKKDHTIAYGPFLSLAALISLFWGSRIIALFFIRF